MAYSKELWVKLRTMYESGQYSSFEDMCANVAKTRLKIPHLNIIKQKALKEGWGKGKLKGDIDKKVLEKAEINTQWVVDTAVELVGRCMQHEPILDHEGNETGEYRFDSAGARGGLQILSGHTGGFDKNRKESSDINQGILDIANKTIDELIKHADDLRNRVAKAG